MQISAILVSLMFALGVGFLLYAIFNRTPNPDKLSQRLEEVAKYGDSPKKKVEGQKINPKLIFSEFTESLNRLLTRSGRTGKLSDDLARADLKIKASEWILGVIGTAIIMGVLTALRFGTPLAFVIVAAIVWFASGFALKILQRRRGRAFDKQLGDTLNLLSNSIKAGNSFVAAMNSVSKNGKAPIAEEFARATREISLGLSLDEALENLVQRNGSEDFDMMVTAVQIQRQVGGNLAEVLDTISYTIRERVRIKGEIRTLTAQARFSGYIILFIPIGLGIFLSLAQPSYFGSMFTDIIGIILLVISGFMMLVGFAIIQKIVKIEV